MSTAKKAYLYTQANGSYKSFNLDPNGNRDVQPVIHANKEFQQQADWPHVRI